MLDEINSNAAEAIPYKNHKDKLIIVFQELKKNRYIEVWDKYIYSAEKWGVKNGDGRNVSHRVRRKTVSYN